MAIAFTTGTINAANAGAVGLAMAEKIRDDVVAHIAWDLVEEYTPASSLATWYVFKCLAAQSGLSNDFFVILCRTIGSGELRMFICEGYNSSTHVASGHTTPGQATNYTYDSVGRRPETYTLSTAVLASSGTGPLYHSWVPSGVSTKWWITVDNDGFTVAFNGASNSFFHVGAYIPLTDLSNPMPICLIGLTPQNEGCLTRNPAVASITEFGMSLQINGGGASGVGSYTPLGFPGRLDANDKLQSDQRPVAEVGITVFQWTDKRAIVGFVLGKQKRMRVGTPSTAPAGIAFGDAYVLQGRLWVPYLPTDYRIWDTGVAV